MIHTSKHCHKWTQSILLSLYWLVLHGPTFAHASDYVIAISVDGMRHDVLNYGTFPNLARLKAQGSSTMNARTDADNTLTLPNHASMLTSRPMGTNVGHGYVVNTPTDQTGTIHSQSVFDKVKAAGKRTAMFANKDKFQVYQQSWESSLDVVTITDDADKLVQEFLKVIKSNPPTFTFLHIANADKAGHTSGWMTRPYLDAIQRIDGYLGDIFTLLASSNAMRGKTTIVLTSDHGGTGNDHRIITNPLHYTIPFMVWGPGVAANGDLYQQNRLTRSDPGSGRPSTASRPGPIRNGDLGNVSLQALGISSISGSVFNVKQDLVWRPAVSTGYTPPTTATTTGSYNFGTSRFSNSWSSTATNSWTQTSRTGTTVFQAPRTTTTWQTRTAQQPTSWSQPSRPRIVVDTTYQSTTSSNNSRPTPFTSTFQSSWNSPSRTNYWNPQGSRPSVVVPNPVNSRPGTFFNVQTSVTRGRGGGVSTTTTIPFLDILKTVEQGLTDVFLPISDSMEWLGKARDDLQALLWNAELWEGDGVAQPLVLMQRLETVVGHLVAVQEVLVAEALPLDDDVSFFIELLVLDIARVVVVQVIDIAVKRQVNPNKIADGESAFQLGDSESDWEQAMKLYAAAVKRVSITT